MTRRFPALERAVVLAVGLAACLSLPSVGPAPVGAAELEVHELTLDNGMTFLFVPRRGVPMVAAGWVVHAGSSDEVAGATGAAHLVEHLLFGGSETIGTRDFAAERALLEKRDALVERLRQPADGGEQAPDRLQRRLTRIDEQLAAIHREGEYARIYAEAGAVGIDARTTRDLSMHSMMLPASRLELWFWMESDRLLSPVFRQIEDELKVVDEEERQRVDTTPMGTLLIDLERVFWGPGHPYSWGSGGRREDWVNLDRKTLQQYFDRAYTPQRLTGALVGDFDVELATALARRYFGRLRPNEGAPTSSTTSDGASPSQAAPLDPPEGPVELTGTCDCASQVEVRYRTVPFGHPDAVPLEVLAGVLNGRTGRLYQSLVLQGGAFSAGSRHSALADAGWFSLFASSRGTVDAAALQRGLEEQLALLRAGGVDEWELQKVKNQITTDAARQVERPLPLLLRLLTYQALGDWRRLVEWEQTALAVSADDLERVLSRYFEPERRGVLRVDRAVGAGG